MLYVDQVRILRRSLAQSIDCKLFQPNQVGFSYDVLTNGSANLLTGGFSTPPKKVPQDQPGFTFLNGTFSSLNSSATTNTTQISALAIWHFLQGFLSAFPQYNPVTYPNSNKSV